MQMRAKRGGLRKRDRNLSKEGFREGLVLYGVAFDVLSVSKMFRKVCWVVCVCRRAALEVW